MNNKKIIEIVISVAAFLGSVYVLYSGLHTSSPPPNIPLNVSASQSGNLLPYGTTLDFSILEKQHFQYGAIPYPTLDPSSEVGKDVNTLIVPQAAGQ